MPVTFLTTEDAEKLVINMDKLQKQTEILDSAVRDLSFYVHKELGPLLQKVEAKLSWIDQADEENRFLKSKKYKQQIIKEYTDSLVTAQK